MDLLADAKAKLLELKSRRRELEASLEDADDDERQRIALENTVVIEDIMSVMQTISRLKGKVSTVKTYVSQDRASFLIWEQQDSGEASVLKELQLEALNNVEFGTAYQRELLALNRSGMTNNEIALIYGISPSTVSRTISKAKASQLKGMEIYVKSHQAAQSNGDNITLDLSSYALLDVIASVLTIKQQMILYLRYVERLSFSYCAAILGVAECTLSRTATRALKRLEKIYSQGDISVFGFASVSELVLKAFDCCNIADVKMPAIQNIKRIKRQPAKPRAPAVKKPKAFEGRSVTFNYPDCDIPADISKAVSSAPKKAQNATWLKIMKALKSSKELAAAVVAYCFNGFKHKK